MEAYLRRGDLPSDTEVRSVVEDLALDTLIEEAGPEHVALLRALTLFDLPMPAAVTDLLGERTGGSVRRLCGLGLADTFPDVGDPRAVAASVNALAAGRLVPLTDAERAEWAAAVVQPLLRAWGGAEQQHSWSRSLDLQIARLAVRADDPAAVALCAADAVYALRAGPAEAALALGQQSIAVLERHATPVPVRLLRRVADAAVVSGDGDTAVALFDRAVETVSGGSDTLEHARVIAEYAGLLSTRGELAHAERLLYQARDIFTTVGSEGEAAVAWGRIADILYRRGDYDEALRIRREVQLPVYERLGDAREIAVTWGRIADILFQRGDYDEALRIRREVQLPVYERLGDARETAVTWGRVADILFHRGDYDEALRIRREVQLPVYERLGDTRSAAVTWGKIADIVFHRGDYDEALRICREVQLPVFGRLGDPRSVAVTWGKIADILFRRGDYDEALRICREVQLPVYERLGDTRETALTWGKIADILFRRGDHDEALRICRELQLPVYERLGDTRSVAVTWGKIADILYRRGDYDEALRIRRELQLPVYERLGDTRELAVTWGRIADILFQRGDDDEALRIRRDVQRPVFEKLGDLDGIANVSWGVAQVHLEHNDLQSALPEVINAYTILDRLQRPDGLAVVGGTLGQLLVAAGRPDVARPVLETSLAAAHKISFARLADQISGLLREIGPAADPAPDPAP